MAELILRLRTDPETGKKTVVVQYHSDADALPMEHEEDHQRLVEQLIAGGTLTPDEVGEIVVERLPESTGVDVSTDEGVGQRQSVDVDEAT